MLCQGQKFDLKKAKFSLWCLEGHLIRDPVRHIHLWVGFSVDDGVSGYLLTAKVGLKEELMISVINEKVIGR